MFGDNLPSVLQNVVRDLLNTHCLKKWYVDSCHSGDIVVTLKWTSPSTPVNPSPRQMPSKPHKSPSKRARDNLRSKNWRAKRQLIPEASGISESLSNDSTNKSQLPPPPCESTPSKQGPVKLEARADSALPGCVQGQAASESCCESPTVLDVSQMMHRDDDDISPLAHRSRVPQCETSKSPSPAGSDRQAGCDEQSVTSVEVGSQCAFDGSMYRESANPSDITKELQCMSGEKWTGAWCDCCSEPIRTSPSFVCRVCPDRIYCTDCFASVSHPDHDFRRKPKF